MNDSLVLLEVNLCPSVLNIYILHVMEYFLYKVLPDRKVCEFKWQTRVKFVYEL